MQDKYDIIVIGGGHAGVEASYICAKMGLHTLLITHLIDNIALASCNPAIGGLGKGHLVKEIDSLGGLMGAITDISGLQYRILNASKGPAVRGTRAQIDMDLYRKYARDLLLQTKNLTIIQANATKILSEDNKANGVEISIKKQFFAEKIIITAGTFLSGLIHIGESKSQNGRVGEIASNELSQSLKSLGIPLARLKTGTCPRILGSSIDSRDLQKHYGDAYCTFNERGCNAKLEEIPIDSNQPIMQQCTENRTTKTPYHAHTNAVESQDSTHAPYFSLLTYDFIHHKRENIISEFLKERVQNNYFRPKELPCFVTYTNENTHKMIEENFYRAPLFTGQIKGVGPRYCPSIEDKVNRFRDKARHQLFLEPQTYSAGEYYINGLTTSLPYQVQEEVIRSIKGLENALITRYGYAIEYDYSQPTNLYHTLESKIVKNLYLAGQINGTTGYEEAAAQGIMAGINASLSLLHQRGQSKRESLILQRDESYIAVMIDDLVTKGTNEPYRVFTSRAEYRLLLREDNACFRLLPYADELSLLDSHILEELHKDKENITSNLTLLDSHFTPNKHNLEILAQIGEDGFNNVCNFNLILGRDSMNANKMRKLHVNLATLSNRALEQLRI
ncbi:tRNA uridine-5-carboxymethylaminomethyl(34) synthesis enzyme MnmG, partial [Helicobacter sp. MIT 14-3879]